MWLSVVSASLDWSGHAMRCSFSIPRRPHCFILPNACPYLYFVCSVAYHWFACQPMELRNSLRRAVVETAGANESLEGLAPMGLTAANMRRSCGAAGIRSRRAERLLKNDRQH